MKYGFVYIWRDRKHNRYYIGAHWGTEDDGYICSSNWMKKAYKIRPTDFKRRILSRIYSFKADTFIKEQEWLSLIKPEEIKIRYYNLHTTVHHWSQYPENIKTIREKISYTQRGRKHTEEWKKNMSLKRKGCKPSYIPSEETKKKISQKAMGRKHSNEWKEANSKRLTEQWASGIRKGKEFQTEESNRKRSESMKLYRANSSNKYNKKEEK